MECTIFGCEWEQLAVCSNRKIVLLFPDFCDTLLPLFDEEHILGFVLISPNERPMDVCRAFLLGEPR
jgi:hypothetical protein